METQCLNFTNSQGLWVNLLMRFLQNQNTVEDGYSESVSDRKMKLGCFVVSDDVARINPSFSGKLPYVTQFV